MRGTSAQHIPNDTSDSVLPIVDGPPEGYHGFQPNNHSVITLDAYPDPRDLATLLRRLDADEALYRTYFTYKNQLARESAAGREESGTSSRPSGMPSLVDPLFRQRWLNATANRDRGWCGLCRRAALYKQKRRERLSDAPPLFSDDDIFANRAIPVPEHVMPGLACAARGKFNYIHGLVKARDGG